MANTVEKISKQQQTWAAKNKKPFDDNNRMCRRKDNFFMPLSQKTIANFKKGSGDEFGTDGSPGKINSLYSSSALACNVFEYWRTKDLNPIARLCGARYEVSELHFEKQHPTGLMGTPPNLDVEFSGDSNNALAIESKFTEIYHPKKHTEPFRESYFRKEEIWANLPACKKLAEAIRDRTIVFTYLDAPQLIKHSLGLMRSCQSKDRFTLTYLWYDFPGPELDRHNTELSIFKEKISDDIDFVAIPYHRLFEELRKLPDIDPAYLAYLHARYFARIQNQ